MPERPAPADLGTSEHGAPCTAFLTDESMASDITSWNAMHGALLRDPSLMYTPEQVHVMLQALIKPPVRVARSEQIKSGQVGFDKLRSILSTI